MGSENPGRGWPLPHLYGESVDVRTPDRPWRRHLARPPLRRDAGRPDAEHSSLTKLRLFPGHAAPAPRLLKWIWVLYAVSVLLVTLQKGLTHPGNFLLFRCTFDRLMHDENLYLNTPGCFGYLYSPAFAFLFAPFALLPPLVGLFCWNAVNAAVPALAISRL